MAASAVTGARASRRGYRLVPEDRSELLERDELDRQLQLVLADQLQGLRGSVRELSNRTDATDLPGGERCVHLAYRRATQIVAPSHAGRQKAGATYALIGFGHLHISFFKIASFSPLV